MNPIIKTITNRLQITKDTEVTVSVCGMHKGIFEDETMTVEEMVILEDTLTALFMYFSDGRGRELNEREVRQAKEFGVYQWFADGKDPYQNIIFTAPNGTMWAIEDSTLEAVWNINTQEA